MRKYKLLKKKGEGTFSEVLAAQNIKTSDLCDIKCALGDARRTGAPAKTHRSPRTLRLHPQA